MAELTEKQKRFCEEYIIDLNATQAAIRAGYSEKTAKEIGYEHLTKPHIQEYISELKKKVSERLELSVDWVVNRLKDISDRCMQAEPVMIFDPDSRSYVESGEYKFDSSGANKATELLGKHLGAFEKDNKQKSTIVKTVLKGIDPPAE
jgi:phage terminase small subunit